MAWPISVPLLGEAFSCWARAGGVPVAFPAGAQHARPQTGGRALHAARHNRIARDPITLRDHQQPGTMLAETRERSTQRWSVREVRDPDTPWSTCHASDAHPAARGPCFR
jgi:hypothetical protein